MDGRSGKASAPPTIRLAVRATRRTQLKESLLQSGYCKADHGKIDQAIHPNYTLP
ncbi:hypothetical protein HAX54_010426, partial [Datura stramonium]|nr:hypothetical protein [Datura stramonium]